MEEFVCSSDGACNKKDSSDNNIQNDLNNNNDNSNNHLSITIVSDIVCPFCYIGKCQLEKALQQIQSEKRDEKHNKFTYSIQWKPFLLNPTLPAEGMERKEFFKKKFGANLKEGEVPPFCLQIDQMAQKVGISQMNLGNFNLKISNSVHAHRLLKFIEEEEQENGRLNKLNTSITIASLQNCVAEDIFNAYFVKAKDIGKEEVLMEIVEKYDELKSILDVNFFKVNVFDKSDRYNFMVRREAEKYSLVTHGVPYFEFSKVGGKKNTCSGALGVTTFVKTLKKLIL
ncbi:hypothetical protein ABK040_001886 [Willaertia magna]